MALKKVEKSWPELQESVTRIRQKLSTVASTGESSFVSASPSANQKDRRKHRTSTYLPSLKDQRRKVRSRDPHHPGDGRSKHEAAAARVAERPSPEHAQSETEKRLGGLAQSTLRQRAQRERQDHAAALHFMENKAFAQQFVNSLIRELLCDELIPDLLIEGFSVKHAAKDTAKRSRHIGGSATAVESLMPLSGWVLDELLQEVLHDVSAEVIRTSVKDLVDTHLAQAAVHHCASDVLSETLALLLLEVARAAQEEAQLEAQLLPEVVAQEAREVALSVLAERDSETAACQLAQVSHYATKRLLDVFLMGHLVELAASQGQCFLEKELSGRLLDSWMIEMFIHQFFRVQRLREQTLQSAPVRSLHRQIVTDVILDVILSELTESMDEDMGDLLEYEQLMEEGTPL
ncbi:uncharacterized protein [Lepisosteus oculatus]|uniref:uncharacterized protein isoform X6 n=1 Tax=Lepisosteus oculatus TaxID=7918 RepID=UPI0037137416